MRVNLISIMTIHYYFVKGIFSVKKESLSCIVWIVNKLPVNLCNWYFLTKYTNTSLTSGIYTSPFRSFDPFGYHTQDRTSGLLVLSVVTFKVRCRLPDSRSSRLPHSRLDFRTLGSLGYHTQGGPRLPGSRSSWFPHLRSDPAFRTLGLLVSHNQSQTLISGL